MTILRVHILALVSIGFADAQGTRADYERAAGLAEKWRDLPENMSGAIHWIGDTHRFWYRRTIAGGSEFLLVDADSAAKRPAFDHERLAASLSAASKQSHTATKLPFREFEFAKDEKSILFNAGDSRWQVDLTAYACENKGRSTERRRDNGVTRPVSGPPPADSSDKPVASPDGKWEAFTRNYNLAIRAKGSKASTVLSRDGSEGDYYQPQTILWSPDSRKLSVYRIRPGQHRKIQFVQSSPQDQLQPKYFTFEYAKPGDVLDLQQPVLFHVEPGRQLAVDNRLFPNPYALTRAEWRKDSRALTFEYNQRGHQVYRVLEVDAEAAQARTLVEEQSKTFIHYSGKRFRHDLAGSGEIIWASERDGWNHLYLIEDGVVKRQITKGEWLVRGVQKVDEAKRQIWFSASGMAAGEDPYFVRFYRINFDGSGLTKLTEAPANHTVAYSKDMKYYVDTWSRTDLAPAAELRLAESAERVMEVETASIEKLRQAGWKAPEVFTAKGRDGVTDIWGVIHRPMNFDASRRYPVIEYIYAGPHDNHVPKSFQAFQQMQGMAEIGFIVVQIDGMGTSNRSKAFHDVAWKNLKDSGFPDRMAWHRAVGAKYPYYDISRVGIYGTSAGGQNSMGALLFHGDFYKAAVSFCGCHDNRMDKIWWNEQWMGWPIGEEYSECSNVDNAHKLQGRLLLGVGEMDTNVDPASTMQVVNALVRAKKTFDLLVLPGQGHTNGGEYGNRVRNDFFVRHLLGKSPPDWNREAGSN